MKPHFTAYCLLHIVSTVESVSINKIIIDRWPLVMLCFSSVLVHYLLPYLFTQTVNWFNDIASNLTSTIYILFTNWNAHLFCVRNLFMAHKWCAIHMVDCLHWAVMPLIVTESNVFIGDTRCISTPPNRNKKKQRKFSKKIDMNNSHTYYKSIDLPYFLLKITAWHW